MSEKRETKTNGSGSYEVLRNVKLDGNEYVPGDKITSMKKADAEPLILSGAIGGAGSYKKSQADAEVVALGDPKAIKEMVDELKAENVSLKKENKAFQEQLAKK